MTKLETDIDTVLIEFLCENIQELPVLVPTQLVSLLKGERQLFLSRPSKKCLAFFCLYLTRGKGFDWKSVKVDIHNTDTKAWQPLSPEDMVQKYQEKILKKEYL